MEDLDGRELVEPEVFPRVVVFSLCECLGAIADRIPSMLPSSTDSHLNRNRGAVVSLDEALDNQQAFPEGFGF